MAKFFLNPFGISGTRTAIPETDPGDGSINFTNGYGPDYQAPLASDPSALPIDRPTFNELMYYITDAIRQYQTLSVPDFITSADNGGSPFSYSKYVRVRYDPGTGTQVYESLIDSNTDLPTVTASWRTVNSASSQVIYGGTATGAGTANALVFTPAVPIGGYTAGALYTGLPIAANTSATVTANYSAQGNLTIKKSIGGPLVPLAVGDIQIGVPIFAIYNGTNLVLLNPRTYAHGADVATTATVDLTNVTGDYVFWTGTTGVTAVTLAEGREVTCIATGAFTLTNGASLILKSGANISVAAGDTFVLRGEASGVVRNTIYDRADGTALVGSSITAASGATIRTGTNTTQFATASAILSALGFSAGYTSPDSAITAAGSLTLAHSLGRTPVNIALVLVCQTGEGGYSAGDLVFVNPALNADSNAGSFGVSIVPDSTNLNIRWGSSASSIHIIRKDSGNSFAITNANWKARFIAGG